MRTVEWDVVVVAADGTEQHVLSTSLAPESIELADAIRARGTIVKVVERLTDDVPWTRSTRSDP